MLNLLEHCLTFLPYFTSERLTPATRTPPSRASPSGHWQCLYVTADTALQPSSLPPSETIPNSQQASLAPMVPSPLHDAMENTLLPHGPRATEKPKMALLHKTATLDSSIPGLIDLPSTAEWTDRGQTRAIATNQDGAGDSRA